MTYPVRSSNRSWFLSYSRHIRKCNKITVSDNKLFCACKIFLATSTGGNLALDFASIFSAWLFLPNLALHFLHSSVAAFRKFFITVRSWKSDRGQSPPLVTHLNLNLPSLIHSWLNLQRLSKFIIFVSGCTWPIRCAPWNHPYVYKHTWNISTRHYQFTFQLIWKRDNVVKTWII